MKNIQERIVRELNKRHMSIADLARKLGNNYSGVYDMTQRKTMQISMLAKICNALEYNFFRELAQEFPYEQPVFKGPFEQTEIELNERINTLEEELLKKNEEIKILQSKIEVYKEVTEKFGK